MSVPFDHVPPNVALYYLFFVLAASPLIMLERRTLTQMFYENKTNQKEKMEDFNSGRNKRWNFAYDS